ncbi:hypothetical protein EXIGLDRAFT_830488 [Exidia glandulosa HHB12029]|uniref:Uncharacterized protein n=1 Tax=Exidia glandulosa HHB12029 TaxID=1314781 RepID=A0A165NJX2_EXIGL|nr:hypothetical protein EXIGLDRAFT_830488 [Exidia glandulosa HHB12029]
MRTKSGMATFLEACSLSSAHTVSLPFALRPSPRSGKLPSLYSTMHYGSIFPAAFSSPSTQPFGQSEQTAQNDDAGLDLFALTRPVDVNHDTSGGWAPRTQNLDGAVCLQNFKTYAPPIIYSLPVPVQALSGYDPRLAVIHPSLLTPASHELQLLWIDENRARAQEGDKTWSHFKARPWMRLTSRAVLAPDMTLCVPDADGVICVPPHWIDRDLDVAPRDEVYLIADSLDMKPFPSKGAVLEHLHLQSRRAALHVQQPNGGPFRFAPHPVPVHQHAPRPLLERIGPPVHPFAPSPWMFQAPAAFPLARLPAPRAEATLHDLHMARRKELSRLRQSIRNATITALENAVRDGFKSVQDHNAACLEAKRKEREYDDGQGAMKRGRGFNGPQPVFAPARPPQAHAPFLARPAEPRRLPERRGVVDGRIPSFDQLVASATASQTVPPRHALKFGYDHTQRPPYSAWNTYNGKQNTK